MLMCQEESKTPHARTLPYIPSMTHFVSVTLRFVAMTSTNSLVSYCFSDFKTVMMSSLSILRTLFCCLILTCYESKYSLRFPVMRGSPKIIDAKQELTQKKIVLPCCCKHRHTSFSTTTTTSLFLQ
jgi:hypothetical protein